MRIGVDIKAFKNGTTGIARYLRSILDALQKLDEENDYLLFSCAPSDYVLSNPRWKKSTTPWRLPGILWQQFVLPGLLKKHRIDVLWAPEQVCPVFFSGATRVITTVYDLTFLRFPETCVWSNRWIQKLLFPLTISRSNTLAPISDFVGAEVNRYYPRRVHMTGLVTVPCCGQGWSVPAGYDPSKRGDFLFFAGNLEPRKNLVRLVKALEMLSETMGMTVPLHLAGPSGWKNKTLLSLIAQSPVRNAVRHLGYISEKALKQEYLTCKALVYPSLYEGFGLPVLEALSLDCLVLTSRGTVMQEIAGDAALYFDAQDTTSIADAIQFVYDPRFDRDRSLRLRFSVITRYSWEKSAAILLDIFLKAIG
ncbi:MAG: glycosyltransferase family 4 protein [Chitinispirillaceae bacterium]|nr:glycosyltransferase family 4 protein [Chitinispirillaceae bacterium]